MPRLATARRPRRPQAGCAPRFSAPTRCRREWIPKTGEVTGPIADLVRELARRLKVPFTLIPAPNAQGVIAHVQGGTADLGFLAYEEARAREVEFAGPFAVMYNTYLVLDSLAAAQRRGLRSRRHHGGAVRAQTQEIYLSANLKRARVRCRSSRSPTSRARTHARRPKEVDAIALNTQRAAEAVAAAGDAGAGADRQLRGRRAIVRREEGRHRQRRACSTRSWTSCARQDSSGPRSIGRSSATVGRGAGTAQMSDDDSAHRGSHLAPRAARRAWAPPARSPP